MLIRQIVGYLPATILAPLAAFCGLIVFSHILRPDQYGRAVTVLAVVELIQVAWYQWLRLGLLRFRPAAGQPAQARVLLVSALVGWLLLTIAALAFYLPAVLLWPMEARLRDVYLWGTAPLVIRSLMMICLEWHRANGAVRRYSALESSYAILTVLFGIGLIAGHVLEEQSIVLGLALGSAVALVFDLPRLLPGLRPAQTDFSLLARISHFGLPLSLAALLNYVVNSSDRLLLQWLAGDQVVGLYSMAYSLADRSITILFVVVTLPAFPLAMQALDRDGSEAARAQYRDTLGMLAALALPAVVGLGFIAGPLAGAVLGPEYVASTTMIVPWIAGSSLLAGIKAHYFDHAFMLRRRTGLLLWTIAPPAIVNVALNLWWIPLFGAMGAVYSTVVAFAVGLALSVSIGRRIFAMPLPLGPLWRPMVATLAMAAALLLMPRTQGLPALLLLILFGMLVYGIAALLLDVVGIRSRVLALAAAWR